MTNLTVLDRPTQRHFKGKMKVGIVALHLVFMSLLSFAHEHLARLRAIHKHGKMGKRSIATYFLSTKCTFLTSLNGWISTLFVIVYCDTFCMILPRVSQSFTRTQAFLIKDSLLGSKRTRTEHSKIEIKKKERETLESF